MIQYKKRRKYKYNLHSVCTYHTGIKVEKEHKSVFIEIGTDGFLTIHKGYAWDGPSGPTIDTKDFMRGSLVHDALYQLLREGVLDQKYRKRADEIIREICVEDGMWKPVAWLVYQGVHLFGGKHARLDMITAP